MQPAPRPSSAKSSRVQKDIPSARNPEARTATTRTKLPNAPHGGSTEKGSAAQPATSARGSATATTSTGAKPVTAGAAPAGGRSCSGCAAPVAKAASRPTTAVPSEPSAKLRPRVQEQLTDALGQVEVLRAAHSAAQLGADEWKKKSQDLLRRAQASETALDTSTAAQETAQLEVERLTKENATLVADKTQLEKERDSLAKRLAEREEAGPPSVAVEEGEAASASAKKMPWALVRSATFVGSRPDLPVLDLASATAETAAGAKRQASGTGQGWVDSWAGG